MRLAWRRRCPRRWDLALILAVRFRKPWPIVLGIFTATIANHALAGVAGAWVTTLLGLDVLRWVLGGSFIAMAGWMLIPDSVDDEEPSTTPRFGVFGTTVVACFLAEMGDKTQIATAMLAARYQAWGWVVAGTTLGMMLANAPVVWPGDKITKLVPLRIVHVVSALIFLGPGQHAQHQERQQGHARLGYTHRLYPQRHLARRVGVGSIQLGHVQSSSCRRTVPPGMAPLCCWIRSDPSVAAARQSRSSGPSQ